MNDGASFDTNPQQMSGVAIDRLQLRDTHHALPPSFEQVNDDVLSRMKSPGRGYWVLLGIAFALVLTGGYIWFQLLDKGLGLWGLNRPSGWGFDITTFVFWVGITHSGTLMSAIFYLFGAPWRAAISRVAEAMTVFAIMTAGIFPILHLGRAWLFYWMFPLPNEKHLPFNFRSPLLWDVFAISTYLTVSLLFWYLGMVPDLAAVRDRSTGMRKTVYGIFALGWRGSGRQWWNFKALYLLLASLTIPLAISVHSVVSWDFAMGIVPGWHSTIFAPYFVAGAIFSGLALLCNLLILVRGVFHFERYITTDHYDKLGRLLVLMSLLMSFCYASEFFSVWYAAEPAEVASLHYRAFGNYAPLFWVMLLCNCVLPLLLSWESLRRNKYVLFIVAALINLGMYLERLIIVGVSLSRDYDPYTWRVYHPTIYEYGTLAGSIGLFVLLFLLFLRFCPAIPMYEVKEVFHTEAEQLQRDARASGNS